VLVTESITMVSHY